MFDKLSESLKLLIIVWKLLAKYILCMFFVALLLDKSGTII